MDSQSNQDTNLNPSTSKPKLLYKSTLWNLLLFLERWSRRFLFFATLLVIGYMGYMMLQGGLSTMSINNYYSRELALMPLRKWTLSFFFAYREFLLFLWFALFLLLGAPAGIIYLVRKQFPQLIKLALKWLGLLLFIILAYALAGLSADLVMVAIFFSRNLLQAKGVPLTPPFPTLTLP